MSAAELYSRMPRMTPFEAYKMYTAYQLHFNVAKYDVIRYNGKTKLNPASFETRKDKLFFGKLARHKDPTGLLVANFVDGNPRWIGDIVQGDDGERIYLAWLARQQSLTYNFKQDLTRLVRPFNNNFTVVSGEHPPLLTMHLQNQVSKETLVILNSLVHCFATWNKQIRETYIWPPLHHKLLKYRPFVKFDKAKMKAIALQEFA